MLLKWSRNIVEDAKRYMQAMQSKQQQVQRHQQSEHDENRYPCVNGVMTITDSHILAESNIRQDSFSQQEFDAFLLYADEDTDFAKEIITEMEVLNIKVNTQIKYSALQPMSTLGIKMCLRLHCIITNNLGQNTLTADVEQKSVEKSYHLCPK